MPTCFSESSKVTLSFIHHRKSYSFLVR